MTEDIIVFENVKDIVVFENVKDRRH